jgi:hypothetical protein
MRAYWQHSLTVRWRQAHKLISILPLGFLGQQ